MPERKIIYSMQMSLDGYIEDTEGSIGFTNPPDELHRHFNEREAAIDTHIYGRRLYEIMNDYWPGAAADPAASPVTLDYARIWNSKEKLVFSRTLTSVEGRARLATRDIATEVAELKAKPGKDMSLGGATLARDFIALGLVDEFEVTIYPTLLGGGKPMFGDFTRETKLRLIEHRHFDGGYMFLRYAAV
ncbi:dihydrofolate reductase family protein [Pelagibacterium limicola]|uniref:dihydrofolate reductase family protein n=1 Tax=Pelagibacterium limicola TaxID=2791022 RepID=UPI0018B0130F|nr:dihydrofolate reductase family protein [Pelagibacterium limicola]